MSAMNIFTATRSNAESARAAAPRNARMRDIGGRAGDVRSNDDVGTDSRIDEREREDGSDRRIRSKSPEFAALLALLAGAGQQVRNEFLQQLPDESASLVDRLL